MSKSTKRRICLFSRYQLGEQYDLAAEYQPMLEKLCEDHEVLHLSFRNTRLPECIPNGLILDDIPLSVNRNSPRDVILKSILMYFALPIAVWKIRKFKPSLVYVPEILPLVGLFLKWFCGCNVGTAYGDWHVHNFLGKKWWGKPFLKLAEYFERFEYTRLNGLFCRASFAGELLQSWGIPEECIRVVFDAPDPSAFFPQDQKVLRAKLGFAENDTVLLYHGVMHQGKGLDMLIKCTADLYRDDPTVGIIMVGAGPELGQLKQLAADLGLGNRAHFTGWLKTIRDVGEFCNSADLCVAMRTGAESNIHIIPGALLHSMACRKVVISPNLSAIREIVRHGDNGYMFNADDEESFKNLIKELQANRSDWSRVAQNAVEDIRENFSVEAAASQYADALIHFSEIDKPS